MIINLTNTPATPDQIKANVRDVEDKETLNILLSVDINEFVTLSTDTQETLLAVKASRIIEEFVTPIEVKMAKRLLSKAYPTISAVTALYLLRYGTKMDCMVKGFPPLIEVLSKMLKTRGHDPVYYLTDGKFYPVGGTRC